MIPRGKYREVSNQIIRNAGCRVQKDSVTGVEGLMTKLKKTSLAAREMRGEIADLKREVGRNKASTLRQLELEKKVQELDDLRRMVEVLQQTMDAIPPEILAVYGNAEKRER